MGSSCRRATAADEAPDGAKLPGGDEPLGAQDHRRDDQDREDRVAPLLAAAQHFRQQGEEEGAEQRAEHGLGAAEEDEQDHGDAEQDRIVLGLDVAEVVPVQPPAEPRERRADGEGERLVPADVDAEEIGDGFVVVHRHHVQSEPRPFEEGGDEKHGEGERRDAADADVGEHRVARRPAHHFEVEEQGLQHLAEGERGQGEVDAPGPQHRHRDDQREHERHHPGADAGQPGRHAVFVAGVGGEVGADAHEPGHPQVELAGRQRPVDRVGEDDVQQEDDENAFEIAAHAGTSPGRSRTRRAGRSA